MKKNREEGFRIKFKEKALKSQAVRFPFIPGNSVRGWYYSSTLQQQQPHHPPTPAACGEPNVLAQDPAWGALCRALPCRLWPSKRRVWRAANRTGRREQLPPNARQQQQKWAGSEGSAAGMASWSFMLPWAWASPRQSH